MVERWCPRCSARRLIVLQGSEVFAVTGLSGRDVGSLAEAMVQAGVGEAEVELIVEFVLRGV